MPHRIINQHKPRHRTHTVKMANRVLTPMGSLVKPEPAVALAPTAILETAIPAATPAVVETV